MLRSALHRAARVTGARCYHSPPLRDVRFLLYDVHDIEKHYGTLEHLSPCDRETIDMVIEATASLCTNELAPLNEVADQEGCTRVDAHQVTTPSGFKAAYYLFAQSGWQGLSFPERYGGQGLPLSLALVQSEMTATANWTWNMFPGLSKGCINTLVT